MQIKPKPRRPRERPAPSPRTNHPLQSPHHSQQGCQNRWETHWNLKGCAPSSGEATSASPSSKKPSNIPGSHLRLILKSWPVQHCDFLVFGLKGLRPGHGKARNLVSNQTLRNKRIRNKSSPFGTFLDLVAKPKEVFLDFVCACMCVCNSMTDGTDSFYLYTCICLYTKPKYSKASGSLLVRRGGRTPLPSLNCKLMDRDSPVLCVKNTKTIIYSPVLL